MVSAEEQAGAVQYRVRVVYQNDGDPVPNVTLTAVAIAPDGAEAAPVTFAKADTAGEYEATVWLPAPGAWEGPFRRRRTRGHAHRRPCRRRVHDGRPDHREVLN